MGRERWQRGTDWGREVSALGDATTGNKNQQEFEWRTQKKTFKV
jgi:hypothetical protein